MSESTNANQNQPTRQRRKSRQQLSSTQVMFAVILAIALMLAVQFSSRINSERSLNQIRNTVQEEIVLLRTDQADLIEDLAFVQSDAYVEQWARAEGRMVRDNMVLVIPIESSFTVPEVAQDQTSILPDDAQVETTLPDPEPWELWWALFFDAPAPQFNS
ncbi:MAG: hypothetical protein WBC91_11680 [Phototrophicaceae bacterium]